MSSIPASIDPTADRAFARRVHKALAAKERRELHPALWAGLSIFVGLPLLWSLILILIDPRHYAMPGIATLLGLCGGWLFAAIIAAQTVCRDFGRAPGVFLTGLPVTRQQIIESKVAASFRLVVLLIASVAAVELLQLPFAQRLPSNLDPLRYALPAVFLPLCSWLLAFISASITRNTLTAIVISIICLALISSLPFVSTRAANWLFPLFWDQGLFQYGLQWALTHFILPHEPDYWDWQVQQAFAQQLVFYVSAATVLLIGLVGFVRNRLRDAAQRRRTTFWRPLLLIFLFLFLCSRMGDAFVPFVLFALFLFVFPSIGGWVSRIALRSERGLRLSMRALVSGIAALILGLFLLAMREVGATGRVAFTHWTADRNGVASISAGTRFVAASTYVRRYELFRASDRSEFDAQVRALLPVSDYLIQSLVVLSDRDACGVLQMYVTPEEVPDSATPRSLIGERWISYARLDPERGTLDHAVRLPFPDRVVARNLSPTFDATIVGDELFVMLCLSHPNPSNKDADLRIPSPQFLKYRLGSAGPPELAGDWDTPDFGGWPIIGSSNLNSPNRWFFARGCDGRTYVVNPAGAAIDVAEMRIDGRQAARFYPSQTDDEYSMMSAAQFPVSPTICAVSTQRGLGLLEAGIPGDTFLDKMRKPAKLLGEIRASPWAWLFRAQLPTLLAGRKNQLWEIHGKSAICYDVTDPTRPRRILHVQTYPITAAASGTNFLVLSHGPGFSIVLHPTP